MKYINLYTYIQYILVFITLVFVHCLFYIYHYDYIIELYVLSLQILLHENIKHNSHTNVPHTGRYIIYSFLKWF